MGGEIRLAYAPSTRFSAEDRLDGRPWTTRLPFPVHVVERAETIDHVTGTSFVERYTYRDGHYEEREFRGFGRVERWDTETRPGAGPPPVYRLGNAEENSHVPPVR